MTQIKYEVVGIGNAIVDIIGTVDENFLYHNNLDKGTMQLVDEKRAAQIYSQLGQTRECSGGSVANTLAGMASLGAKTAFIGKIACDQLGEVFAHDMRNVGVHFDCRAADSGPATASCLVCVTQDAQRTMATFIGACNQVAESDIDEKLIAASQVLYIEGYLWDLDNAKAAIRKAISAAKKHGRKVALTLSDKFCVDRFREEFLALISSDIDILFANQAELLSLYETENFDAAIQLLQSKCELSVVTRSEKGAVVVTKKRIEKVPGERVANLVDTTGAGDLFAAGFLYGYARSWLHTDSAALGNRMAAHIITQLGARSQVPLKTLLAA